jgi:hypothetical protein
MMCPIGGQKVPHRQGYRFRRQGYRFRRQGYRFRRQGYRFRRQGYRFRRLWDDKRVALYAAVAIGVAR